MANWFSIVSQDISKIKLSSLRKNISLVSQDTTLFDDTIMNNIIYNIQIFLIL